VNNFEILQELIYPICSNDKLQSTVEHISTSMMQGVCTSSVSCPPSIQSSRFFLYAESSYPSSFFRGPVGTVIRVRINCQLRCPKYIPGYVKGIGDGSLYPNRARIGGVNTRKAGPVEPTTTDQK
jgi:hypothetical protein